MNQKAILETIKKTREITKKRKFSQTFDLIVNLQQINPKKADEKVDLFVTLKHQKSKKPKITGLVDKELETKSKEAFQQTVLKEEFSKYKGNKILLKKLTNSSDYFVAQANLMGEIASVFGKTFGPKGKMPNPKAGCVVPPVIPSLMPIAKKLELTARLQTKEEKIVKTAVGKESLTDEELLENIQVAYNALTHALPNEEHNVKSVYLKLTMGQPVEITEKGPKVRVHKKDIPKEETPKKAEVPKEEVKEEPKEKPVEEKDGS
tara:strand:+ start:68 stop:856 length:789 start_codon:yes stop_codon:yes gene_type:complete